MTSRAVPSTSSSVRIDDVLARMDARLAELHAAGDARRVFLAVYRTMSGSMRQAIAEGRFVDPAWTERLTVAFAQLYFDADRAWCDGRSCASPWAAAFVASERPRVTTIEHALLGINAHIVYDLPRAVAATMAASGDVHDGQVTEAVVARRRFDYEVVNQVLAETVDRAQEVLAGYVPRLRVVDTVAARLDEYAAEALLRVSRTQGWHAALALAVATTSEERTAIEGHLERLACSYVDRIDLLAMVPTATGRRLVGLVRPALSPPG